MDQAPVEVTIHNSNSPINLDQFLKLTGAAASGGEAHFYVTSGMVTINGRPALSKRQKLFPGDTVGVSGKGAWRIAAS